MINPTDADIGRPIAYYGIWAEGGVIFGEFRGPVALGYEFQCGVNFGEWQARKGYRPDQVLNLRTEDLDWAD